MSGFMLRLLLLFLLTVMSGADNLFPEENFFQGLELGSPSTEENFFSGVAVDPGTSTRVESEAETEIRSYWARISGSSNQRPTPDRILRDLQDKVRITQGNDAEALYEFSRALMYWSREPAFRSQMSSMNRMAGIYLQKAMELRGDQSVYALKARHFYQRQFGSSLSSELMQELEQAESAAASGNLTEAEGIVRRLAHQTSFRDRRVLRLMEGILRSKASSESDPERAATFTAEANFIARSLAETGAEEEAIMAQIEDSPTGQSPSQSPATITTDQRAVDSSIDQAYQLDKTNKPSEALNVLKELNRNTGYRSAKARYYLGRQLIRMARLPEFRSQQEEFLAQGNQHLTEARNLRGRHLEQFPDNSRFADESEKLYREIDRINLANDQERAVDNLIGKALELNGFNKHQEALAELNQAVTVSERKCAKSLYFLGKQYILLNNASLARTNLEASKALRTQNLTVYTQNDVWGIHASNLLEQMTASTQTVPTPTPRPDPEVTPRPEPAPQVVADGSSQSLVKPLSGSVTSPYGMRTHPIHRTQRMHGGLDIGARRGTPIKAMANGKIIHVGWISGYGKTVKVRYDNGYESLFAHMHNYNGANGESRVNQRVRVGESVGQVNSTGGSTGDHLHLELRRNGTRISPAEVLGKQNRRGETL